ncbi:YraN family protein [Thalassospira sp. SM2505]|uniref:YraN family protein n=1 Tax=Thalassospira TaxID=168934 RepID=UPI000DED6606|nr:YraN family protein [Thalassospira profundimaris]
MPHPRPLHDQTSHRKRAEKAGRRAEAVCVFWLRLKGYRILATRHQSPVGEIDIIAKRGNVLIAVEVKNRADRDTALRSLRPKQQNRIARALESYAGQIGHSGDLRFDLMIVRGFARIEHLCNAWQMA